MSFSLFLYSREHGHQQAILFRRQGSLFTREILSPCRLVPEEPRALRHARDEMERAKPAQGLGEAAGLADSAAPAWILMCCCDKKVKTEPSAVDGDSCQEMFLTKRRSVLV